MTNAKLVDAQGKLCLTRSPFNNIYVLSFFDMVLVIGDLGTSMFGSLAKPLDAFPLTGAHSPTVTASESVEKHGSGVILFGSQSEMIRRFLERSSLVQLDTLFQMVFGC